MAELSGNGLLTYGERYLAEHKGGRQRSLALLALEKYGPVLGINASELEMRAESVRTMDKEAARKFRQGLRKAGETLLKIQSGGDFEQTLPVSDEVSIAGIATGEKPIEEAEPSYSIRIEDFEDLKRGDDLPAVSSVPSIGDNETNEHGDPEPEEDHSTNADVRNDTAVTLEGKEGETRAEEASTAMRLFIGDITGDKMGNLTPEDEQRIIEHVIQSGLLPATRQRRDGSKIDAEARLQLFFQRMGDLQAVASAEDSNTMAVAAWFRKIRQKAVAEREKNKMNHVPGETQESSPERQPMDEPKPLEGRSIDEEPTPVRLANEWARYLDLGSGLKSALEEMLNPNGSPKISDNKREVADIFWDIFAEKDGHIKPYDIDPKKMGQLYKLFGVAYNSQNKKAQQVHTGPDMLARRVAHATSQGNVLAKDGMIQNTHEGMRELLGILQADRAASWTKIPEVDVKIRPLQVIDGKLV